MPTIILGKPLTFGDKEQIDFIRKEAYSAFLKQFYYEEEEECEYCDGRGYHSKRIYECPSCHYSDGILTGNIFERIDAKTFTCTHCKKEFKFEE